MNYRQNIELLKITRKRMLDLLDSLSLDQLLYVPDGFQNNIFWNIAHALVTQQLLHYQLTGNQPRIHAYWIDNFRKATKAGEVAVSKRELLDLKELLVKSPLWLEKDYEDEIFSHYTSYPTSYGVELTSIDQAIAFNNIHEGLHLGYAMAQKKNQNKKS